MNLNGETKLRFTIKCIDTAIQMSQRIRAKQRKNRRWSGRSGRIEGVGEGGEREIGGIMREGNIKSRKRDRQ